MLLVFRLILGAIFTASGIAKLSNRIELISVVSGYGLLPQGLVEFYGSVLPWVELIIGCLLVLGLFSKMTSITGVVLLVSFISANIYTMFSGNGSGSSLCGCFGAMIPLNHIGSLILGSLMLLLAIALLFGDSRLFIITPSIGGWVPILKKLTALKCAVPILLAGTLLAVFSFPSIASLGARADATDIGENVPYVGTWFDSEVDVL